VVTLWLSHQELAVERNVDIGEELFQGRVGVQELQPDVFRRICIYKRLLNNFDIFYGINFLLPISMLVILMIHELLLFGMN
jgi:hypothetical protein